MRKATDDRILVVRLPHGPVAALTLHPHESIALAQIERWASMLPADSTWQVTIGDLRSATAPDAA